MGCLQLCNSGLLTRADVHWSVSRGQLLRYCTVPVLNGTITGPFSKRDCPVKVDLFYWFKVTILVLLILNRTAKIKLAILAFLYCREIYWVCLYRNCKKFENVQGIFNSSLFTPFAVSHGLKWQINIS